MRNTSNNMKRCMVSKVTGAHIGKCFGTCNRHQKSRADRNKAKAKKKTFGGLPKKKVDVKEVPAPVPSAAMEQLIELYNSQDWDKLADFVRDVIAEEIRSGCLHMSGLEHSRDPLLQTDRLSLDFAGAGNHEEDLLPMDEQRDRGKSFYWQGAYGGGKGAFDDAAKSIKELAAQMKRFGEKK